MRFLLTVKSQALTPLKMRFLLTVKSQALTP